MRERIIVAVIFVPLLFAVLFFLPPYVLTIVVSLISIIGSHELISAVGIKGNQRVTLYAGLSAASIPMGVYFGQGGQVFRAAFLILILLTFVEAIVAFKTPRAISFTHVMAVVFGGALIPYLLSSLVSLKVMPEGRLFVLMPVIIAFITDGGAYFSGVFFGKRKAFPLVSPKKTVEGCVGGIASSVAAMALYGVIVAKNTPHEVTFWALLLFGLIGGVVTELGDLAFSLIKRELDIKDYGKLLPGHGGMLDRFDSMTFAAPAIYLLATVVPAIVVA